MPSRDQAHEFDLPRVILASGSPRRRTLFARFKIPFDVVESGVDEDVFHELQPHEIAHLLSVSKARAVARTVGGKTLVLAGDTVIDLDGSCLGKPRDGADAERILWAIRGRSHRVVTGVTWIRWPQGEIRSGWVATRVRMRAFEPSEMVRYIESGEPFGKAGAYAIQGGGKALVDRFEGCYNNVIGLPLCEVRRLLLPFLGKRGTLANVCRRPDDRPCPREGP